MNLFVVQMKLLSMVLLVHIFTMNFLFTLNPTIQNFLFWQYRRHWSLLTLKRLFHLPHQAEWAALHGEWQWTPKKPATVSCPARKSSPAYKARVIRTSHRASTTVLMGARIKLHVKGLEELSKKYADDTYEMA